VVLDGRFQNGCRSLWGHVLALLCGLLAALPAPQVVYNLGTSLAPSPVRTASDTIPDDDEDGDQVEVVTVRVHEILRHRRGVDRSAPAHRGALAPERSSSQQTLSPFGVPFEHARRNGVGAPLLC
jgi:hypothetical protein